MSDFFGFSSSTGSELQSIFDPTYAPAIIEPSMTSSTNRVEVNPLDGSPIPLPLPVEDDDQWLLEQGFPNKNGVGRQTFLQKTHHFYFFHLLEIFF